MSKERYKVVSDIIAAGRDERMVREMELKSTVNDEKEYGAFLEILLILIQESKYRDQAVNVLIEKIIKGKDFSGAVSLSGRRNTFINNCRDNTPFPYLYVSNFFRRVLLEILRDENSLDSEVFMQFLPLREYLNINIFYFENYIIGRPLDLTGMNLFYGCIENKHLDFIILNRKAKELLKAKLKDIESLRYYMRYFFRPYWTSTSRDFPEDSWHVPEPFYRQIFDNKQAFILFLLDQDLVGDDNRLRKEIIQAMFYIDEKDKFYFDIEKEFKPSKSLHKGIRF